MSNQRKHKFINRPLQIKIAIEVVLHAVLLVALIALILFAEPFVVWFSSYSAEDHVAVSRDLVALNKGKWPLFLALAAFIGFVSVLFSHHIAGPVFHLQRVLRDLNDRQLDVRVRFRKWDYLGELQDNLNGAIARWQEDVALMGRNQSEALTLLRELHTETLSREKLLEIEKRIEAIASVVSTYRT